MATAQSMKIELSSDAMRAIKGLTRALEEHTRVQIEIARDRRTSVEMHVTNSDGYHDDETMMKVSNSIRQTIRQQRAISVEDVDRIASDIVTELQNAGILFRERRPD